MFVFVILKFSELLCVLSPPLVLHTDVHKEWQAAIIVQP